MFPRHWARRSMGPWGWYCGPMRSPGLRRGLSREDRIRFLEEHQRDLEQRAADTADLIRWLRGREGEPAPTATAPAPGPGEEQPPS